MEAVFFLPWSLLPPAAAFEYEMPVSARWFLNWTVAFLRTSGPLEASSDIQRAPPPVRTECLCLHCALKVVWFPGLRTGPLRKGEVLGERVEAERQLSQDVCEWG